MKKGCALLHSLPCPIIYMLLSGITSVDAEYGIARKGSIIVASVIGVEHVVSDLQTIEAHLIGVRIVVELRKQLFAVIAVAGITNAYDKPVLFLVAIL